MKSMPLRVEVHRELKNAVDARIVEPLGFRFSRAAVCAFN
jgi:hypothetical protein